MGSTTFLVEGARLGAAEAEIRLGSLEYGVA
jgi:hypothetical protein